MLPSLFSSTSNGEAVKHYEDDVDTVTTAGVQAPWPGALYNKPVVIHSHASTGMLRRSYMPEQNLDGFSGHYCMGSTDSFGMPLQGFSPFGADGISGKTMAVVGIAALALIFVATRKA